MSAATVVRTRRVAIIGNPNTGKTTLFNALTGLNQRVGNYPGVTVEKKTGTLAPGVEALDLPGTYSLAARSPDEMVAVNVLLGEQDGEARPDLAIVIADAGNLQRNLYLATQVLETGVPVVLALNMVDAAEAAGVTVDAPALARALGVAVVPCVATRGEGVEELRRVVSEALAREHPAFPTLPWAWPEALRAELELLAPKLPCERFLLARALIDEGGPAEALLAARHGAGAGALLAEARLRVRACGAPPAKLEIQMRYGWIGQAIAPCVDRRHVGPSVTDRLDAVLTHRVWGSLVFAVLMTGIFLSIFLAAEPFMNWIDEGFGWLQDLAAGALRGTSLEGGALASLLVKGVLAGVRGVLVFLPQIAFLFLFIALLEDCGYLARAAFLMDRVLRFCGLSGHSFLPLMSSFACAVPGLLATRTIADRKDRFATILVAPLMSCSARIPVYAIMCYAFVPDGRLWGLLPLRGLVFAGMYFVGIAAAVPVAYLLKRLVLKGPPPAFVMELPTYKWPVFRTVVWRVYEASREFALRAGTVIFAISVVIWALCYFPRSAAVAERFEAERQVLAAAPPPAEEREARLKELGQHEEAAYLEASLMGHMGHAVEPLVKPLGWDWRIGMATVASFPAREVIVSTLCIIYDLGSDEQEDEEAGRQALSEKLQAATWPDGRKVFNLPVALSIMVFFALCAQCGATLATMRRETNSWRWPVFAFVYMTTLAYLGAWVTYHAGMAILG